MKMDKNTELRLIKMSDVEPTKVEWLWYPYIPYGKVTIIQGDPGEGKTTLILNLAALLSKGEKLPESEEKSEPINIIYQTAEDGLSDTVKPRLIAANADDDRITVIDTCSLETVAAGFQSIRIAELPAAVGQDRFKDDIEGHRTEAVFNTVKHCPDSSFGTAVQEIGEEELFISEIEGEDALF